MLVYFVTDGPAWGLTDLYDEVWQVLAIVSEDGGKTVTRSTFSFATEEHAIEFKRDINFTLEPTKIGEDDDE